MKALLSILSIAVLAVCLVVGLPASDLTLASVQLHDGSGSPLQFLGLGGLVINMANLKSLFTGFKASFQKAFSGAKPLWSRIATEVPSSGKEEKYGWLGQYPRLREWLGDRQIKGLALHDYSIKNKKFESTIGVPRDDIEDDTYGLFSTLFAEQGYAAATHPDELVYALLGAGFTTNCFDSQYFFDTDHPVGNEDTGVASVSNMQAGAGAPWFLLDTRRPLKPIVFQKRRDYDFRSLTKLDDDHVFKRDEFLFGVDARVNVGFGLWQLAFGSKATLDATNFEAGYAAMMAFKSDEGRPLGVIPDLLVCGPTNRSAALKVVEAQNKANGESNTNYKAVEVLVVPWLT